MIELVEVAIDGKTQSGPFRGQFVFGRGLQLLVGPNRFGKSLAFAAIVWCLGVEHIFGVQPGDASIFPDAARSRVNLDGVEETVTEASATLVLRRDDGATLRLSREIVGNVLTIAFDDGKTSANLIASRGTMADLTGGFQVTFREWARIPAGKLLTSRGAEVPIYLENLAALFLVEQIAGWSDIQGEQIYRYGTQEIAEGSFELLLGLDRSLERRFDQQGRAAKIATVREEARSISLDFAGIAAAQGWATDLSVAGSFDAVVTRWEKVDLFALIREQFNFDIQKELKNLSEKAERLRIRITKGKVDTDSTAETTEVSSRVVGLKETRHDLQTRLATLRAQLREQAVLLLTTEHRLKSAKDLRRLKVEHIGILPKAECPTCHQSVDPEHLHLTEHSVASLDVHAAQLDRERLMLASNVDSVRREVLEVTAKASRVEAEFVAAEKNLKMVNQTVGPAREVFVKLAGDLVTTEQELQRVRSLQTQLEALRDRLRQWIEGAKVVAIEDKESATEKERLRIFTARLRKYIVDLGCAGVPATDEEHIGLDDRYIPTYRNRLLRSFGSASDRARLITAYVTALSEVGLHHPGFVVLDEPLQQNPDPIHRRRFLDFLKADAASLHKQTLVFTALNKDEVDDLKAGGVAVQTFEGKFLRKCPPPELEESTKPNPKNDVSDRDGGVEAAAEKSLVELADESAEGKSTP